MKVLQNTSICSHPVVPPTIKIVESEPEWEEAYKNWMSGKNPTSDPKWKQGVYFHLVEG